MTGQNSPVETASLLGSDAEEPRRSILNQGARRIDDKGFETIDLQVLN